MHTNEKHEIDREATSPATTELRELDLAESTHVEGGLMGLQMFWDTLLGDTVVAKKSK